jgi:hypothetical protein
MPSKVWEKTKVVFAPTGRIPSFEGKHRGLFSGSVVGRLKSPPLLIRLRDYHNSNVNRIEPRYWASHDEERSEQKANLQKNHIPRSRAVSTGQCNTCLQFICRSLKSQSFSWSLI